MRWLDAYIDGMRQSTVRIRFGDAVGPFSRIGSVFNVVVCGVILIVALVFVVGGESSALFVVVIAVLLVLVFARVCVRAWRGDFDGDHDLV